MCPIKNNNRLWPTVVLVGVVFSALSDASTVHCHQQPSSPQDYKKNGNNDSNNEDEGTCSSGSRIRSNVDNIIIPSWMNEQQQHAHHHEHVIGPSGPSLLNNDKHHERDCSNSKQTRAAMVVKDCAGEGTNTTISVEILRKQMESIFGTGSRYVMCYSLVYGYLTHDDLRDYDVVYIDGSGDSIDSSKSTSDDEQQHPPITPSSNFHIIRDWLETTPILTAARNDTNDKQRQEETQQTTASSRRDGGAAFLEEFMRRGKKLFFNAAPSLLSYLEDGHHRHRERRGRDEQEPFLNWSLPFGAHLHMETPSSREYYSTGIFLDGNSNQENSLVGNDDEIRTNVVFEVSANNGYLGKGWISSHSAPSSSSPASSTSLSYETLILGHDNRHDHLKEKPILVRGTFVPGNDGSGTLANNNNIYLGTMTTPPPPKSTMITSQIDAITNLRLSIFKSLLCD